MFAPLTWFFSPIGRWLTAIGSFLAFVCFMYWDGRRAGIEKMKREQAEERERRFRNAIEADNGVRRDIASGRLLENDGHRRD
jgi:hypothetical protein